MARLEVYFNLHRNIFSLRHRGKVIEHAPCVVIVDPWFVVQEAGRQRVLKEKRKNVHSFVCGERSNAAIFTDWELREDAEPGQTLYGWKPARYNPYRSPTFEWTNSDTHNYRGANWYPLHSAEWVALWVDRNGKPRMEISNPQ